MRPSHDADRAELLRLARSAVEFLVLVLTIVVLIYAFGVYAVPE
jgi:hypothetical protein